MYVDFIYNFAFKAKICLNRFCHFKGFYLLIVTFFQSQPALINDVRNSLRDECNNHAEVKKVNVYDVSIGAGLQLSKDMN